MHRLAKLAVTHLRSGLRELMYVDGHNRITTVLVPAETDPDLVQILAECGGCHLRAFACYDLKKRHVRVSGDALDMECHHKFLTRRQITRHAPPSKIG